MLFSSALVTLLLATPSAEAGRIGKKPISIPSGVTVVVDAYTELVPDSDAAASVSAEIKSDAGSEDVDLVETDAWLHGAAAIPSLPSADAAIALTLYDAASAELATYSGTLGTDGSVSLRRGAGFCSCDPGYAGSCDKGEVCIDVEVLAAELFAASKGYELGIDLNGADTYTVAYATVVVTEGKTVTTKAEVGWEDIGSVWEGELGLDHEGLIDVKTRSYDRDGTKVEREKVTLGSAWDDGGYGVSTLAIDPTTSLAITRREGVNGVRVIVQSALVVASTGWTVGATMPASASVELTGGETLSIPVNSYQVAAGPVFAKLGDAVYYDITVDGGSTVLGERATFDALSSPVCADGFCVTLEDGEDGTYAIALTAYAADPGKLPSGTRLDIVTLDKAGAKLDSSSFAVDFDDEVAIVFANEITAAADPIGVGLSGSVTLLDAADDAGKQKSLAKGTFHGTLTRDGDGDLALAGADKGTLDAKGDILIGGEPIDFELTDTDKDGTIDAPPLVFRYDKQYEPIYSVDIEPAVLR